MIYLPLTWQPERISGDPYTVKSDVWSLGITLVELAIGRFPFSSDDNPSDSDDDDDDLRAHLDSLSLQLGQLKESHEDGDHDDDDLGDDTLSPVRPARKAESVQQAEQARESKRASIRSTKPPPSAALSATKKKRKSVAGVSLAGSGHQMSILELLQYIVNEPAPKLPKAKFSLFVEEFVDATLRKEPVGYNVKKKGPLPKEVARPTPRELLEYEWMRVAAEQDTDVEAFAKSIP